MEPKKKNPAPPKEQPQVKKEIIGEVPQEQIAKWKNKYPSGIFALFVEDDDGNTHVTYARKPDVEALSAAGEYAESDPFKSGDILFNTLCLGGSHEIRFNDEMKIGVIKELKKLFKVKKAEVKKL